MDSITVLFTSASETGIRNWIQLDPTSRTGGGVYTKIKLQVAPKRSRRSIARFERTDDWTSMKADLQNGLAPGEGLQVLLTEEEKKKYGIRNRISVARFVKKYVASHNLPYVVRSFRREEGDYIIVQPKQ